MISELIIRQYFNPMLGAAVEFIPNEGVFSMIHEISFFNVWEIEFQKI